MTDGSVVNQAGAVWNLANGIILASGGSGAFTNDGTLTREATTGLNHVSVDFTNGATGTVTIGGELELSGTVSDLAGTIGGAGTLILGGGATTLAAGVDLAVADILAEGLATSVTANGDVVFAGHWSQTGGAVSVTQGTLTFSGASDSFAGTLAGAGAVDFVAGADLLKNATLSAADVDIGFADVTLQGVIDITGELDAVASSPTIAASGVILEGAGTLVLGEATAGVLRGANASARLTNAATIRGAGQLGGGEMSLVNQASGVIFADGSSALDIDTGANVITNAGLIEASGSGGMTIEASVYNTGVIENAGAGVTTIEAPVSNAGLIEVSGSGGMTVEASVRNTGVIENAGTGVTTIEASVSNSGTLEALQGVLAVDGAVTGAGTLVINGGTAPSDRLSMRV